MQSCVLFFEINGVSFFLVLLRFLDAEMVTSLGWSLDNQLFTCSDEKMILKWGLDGEPQTKVTDLDSFATCFQWHQSQQGASDTFAVGMSDGSFILINKAGRVEKKVEAHTGAITSLRWNYEGTAIVTAGEDGFVKQWSRSGNLRSKLSQTDRAVFSVCWSPDNQSVLSCSGRHITIKPLQVSNKQVLFCC